MKSTTIILLLALSYLLFPCEICNKCIGYLNVKDGSVVYEFTTSPGKYGKPKTKVKVITGTVQVFEIYDWAEKYKELKGQKGHKWYRVNCEKSWWTWGRADFKFTPKLDNGKVTLENNKE